MHFDPLFVGLIHAFVLYWGFGLLGFYVREFFLVFVSLSFLLFGLTSGCFSNILIDFISCICIELEIRVHFPQVVAFFLLIFFNCCSG